MNKRTIPFTLIGLFTAALATPSVYAGGEVAKQILTQNEASEQKTLFKDVDEDGVPDEQDHCPNTAPGQQVDQKGCNPELDPPKYVAPEPMDTGIVSAVPIDAPLPEPIFTMNDAFFDFNSAEIRADQRDILSANIDRLKQMSGDEKLLITGHTCDLGPDEYNQQLSERRAQSVMRFTEDMIPELRGRIYALGKGESEPAVANTNIENRKKNRRVELRILPAGQMMPAGAMQ